METIDVPVELRQAGGKRTARRLRRDGKLPGVFYGPETDPVPLQLGLKDLMTRLGGLEGSHLIRIKSGSPLLEDKVALIKEIQWHPITGEALHLDLYGVDLTEKITVRVPIHFVGKAQGVVQGGILQPILREIEVECLPMDIPEYLEIDVSGLDIGHSLHLADLTLPEGVTADYESDIALVSVVAPTVEAPKVEEVPEAAPAEAPEAAAGAPEEKKEGEERS